MCDDPAPVILVVCALSAELRKFTPPGGVEVLAGGVGPVESALATARRLATGRYSAVVNAGLGGAFRGTACIGDAVLVTHESLADFGLEGNASLTLPDGAALIERVAADVGLVACCDNAGLLLGTGLTVMQATATDSTATRLRRRYGADVESMEGFAVLRAAEIAGVPALELRGISNYVGDRARAEWNFAAGAQAAVRALDAVLARLTRTASVEMLQ